MNRNPDTVKEAADRRKLSRGSADPAQPAFGSRLSTARESFWMFLPLQPLAHNVQSNPHNLLAWWESNILTKVAKEASPPCTKTKARAKKRTD